MRDVFRILTVNTSTKAMSCYPHFAAVTSRNHASHIMRKVLISTRLEARLRRSYRLSMILVSSPSTQRDFTKLPAESLHSHASSGMEKPSLYVTGLFRIFSDYG